MPWYIADRMGFFDELNIDVEYESFIGGPAYYMRKGLKQPWMGALFAVLITITFGFAFNSVQSNTLCAAFEGAFGFDHAVVGGIITALTLTIIFWRRTAHSQSQQHHRSPSWRWDTLHWHLSSFC